ncbi:MAG TPA: nucleoside triphosphate pyrophosphohydrolase, partial [Acidobacteriota bacterium]|nr:nucleoside triphosphate pyrophosphohydrolase [Acidobacteriota bacterium]
RQYVLEETYELLQAMDQSDPAAMKEELGDLLFQVVFLAQMMQEKKRFSLLEVIRDLTAKMIGRHPHVFGSTKAASADQALASWESMKSRGVGTKKPKKSLLQGVPENLPALHQAHLISAKVARAGFDWDSEEDVWKKFEEELKEFHEASTRKRKEEEMGDLLFTMVNIARKNKIHPEDALRGTNARFIMRFEELERRVKASNNRIKDVTAGDLDDIWEDIKRRKKKR